MLSIAIAHRFAEGGFALDVALDVPGEGVTALFGPSGCGKTTILAAVAGLMRPAAGRIRRAEEILFDAAAGVFVPPERRRCGVVFQDARLFPHLSVAANLRYGLSRAPADVAGPGFDEVVDLLGIADLLARRPGRLSGGERQRVALGRALLARPLLMLMDEPLAALDLARKAEVLPFLARLRARTRLPVLYVTHALDEVDVLADTLVLLEAGRVVATGPVEALAARTDLALAERRDAGVLIGVVVGAHDRARGLTRLDFAGGSFLVPLRPDRPGSAARLRVRARDVAVAVAEPQGLSVQNVLPATLVAILAGPSPHEAFLRLAVGPTALLARVTRDSVDRLGLRQGQPVWAVIKAAGLGFGGSSV
jgi:molybdate transport system ATP-binding protein